VKGLLGKDRDFPNEMWRKVVEDAVDAEENGALSARKGERVADILEISTATCQGRLSFVPANWN
jgi:hypothetical protein